MMAVVSPSSEQGYIRTVLRHEQFRDLENSSLALPPEGKIYSQGHLDKSLRIQRQVQLTMARKGNKTAQANGSIHRSASTPDQVDYSTSILNRDLSYSPHKFYDGSKQYKTIGYENGWSGGRVSFKERTSEHNTSPRRPTLRRDISPDREGEVTIHDFRNMMGSPRYEEGKQYGTMATRYARSDIVGLNRQATASKARQSISQRFYRDSVPDSVFLNSVPTSPAERLYSQSRNSRSMTNLLERDLYQTQASAVGQVRPIMQPQVSSNKVQTLRSKWNQSTVRSTAPVRESFMSASAGGGIDIGGKKMPMTAGTATVSASTILQGHREGTRMESQIGNVQSMSEVDMTLERAVSLLQNESSYWIATAASFIQHECYQKAEARRQVYSLGGIQKLLLLLKSDNEEVQRAACAALRNLVFEDNDNKLEVCEQRGMPVLLNLLKETQDMETKRQITGLLWNLSSNDQLKTMLIREALNTLTKNIIVPCSGWSDRDYPKNEILSDADIFYNATGCLRNMSSAGPDGRKAMRESDGLIDSLVHYVRRSVADYKPDDKATENCVCILHNLSYQLESELSPSYTQNIYTQSRDIPQDNKNIGCFGSRSRKIKEQWNDAPLAEEKNNPRGVEWLWHSILMRMYLSLIAKSSRYYTQEASLGALQNLTAGNGPMPSMVAHMIIQKENGLPHLRSMLFSTDPGVKRTTVSLLRNLSRNPSLQNEIAKELLPDLIRALPDSVPDSNIANETAASICYVLNNLISKNSDNAQILLAKGGVQKLINISTSDSNLATKCGRVASIVLYNMWTHHNLHGAYKKSMYKKTDFINNRTSKAYQSLRD
ncbi:plakophilin-2 [Rhinophrynus dorsalis]